MSGELESVSPTLAVEQFVQNIERMLERSQENIDENEPGISLCNTVEALTAILSYILYRKQKKQISEIDPRINILDKTLQLLKNNIAPFIKKRVAFTKNLNHDLFRDPGLLIEKKDAEHALNDVKEIFDYFLKEIDFTPPSPPPPPPPIDPHPHIINNIIKFVTAIAIAVAVAVAAYHTYRYFFPNYFDYIKDGNYAKALEAINELKGKEKCNEIVLMWEDFCKIKTDEINTDKLKICYENYKQNGNKNLKLTYQFLIFITDPNQPEEIQKCINWFKIFVPEKDTPEYLLEEIKKCLNSHSLP